MRIPSTLQAYLENKLSGKAEDMRESMKSLLAEAMKAGDPKETITALHCALSLDGVDKMIGSNEEDFQISDISHRITLEEIESHISKFYVSQGLRLTGRSFGGYNFTKGDERYWVNLTYDKGFLGGSLVEYKYTGHILVTVKDLSKYRKLVES